MTPDLIAVSPECWRALEIHASTIRHYTRCAERVTADGLLVFSAKAAYVLAAPELFDGCAGPVPTEAAVAAVERAKPKPPEPVAYADWPAWAKAVAAMRKDGDAGAGDTVKRLLSVGGTLYEATMKALGIPCRCPARRREWTALYNYGSISAG